MKYEHEFVLSKSLFAAARPFLLITGLLFASSGFAQSLSDTEIEIDRDASELSDLLVGANVTSSEVAWLLDTAMIITNISDSGTVARCHANDRNGTPVSRIRVRVPAGGVRFFLMSDLVRQPRGFVGSVVCNVPGHAVGSEIMLGIITTDVDVQQDYRAGVTSILFPVTATR
ncbi:MAG: hypothetical protein KJN90_06000 [Gammaproteobacteria bacterium]|nr:hypothetical protein [Gammaproteobacteria bacterium]